MNVCVQTGRYGIVMTKCFQWLASSLIVGVKTASVLPSKSHFVGKALLCAERERWGNDYDLFQRPGIEKMGGVEDCIQYCQRHPIPDGFDNPQRVRPLISKALLTRWEAHMANEHKQLAWSQEYRRRAKDEQERKRAEAEIAAAQQVCLHYIAHQDRTLLALISQPLLRRACRRTWQRTTCSRHVVDSTGGRARLESEKAGSSSGRTTGVFRAAGEVPA